MTRMKRYYILYLGVISMMYSCDMEQPGSQYNQETTIHVDAKVIHPKSREWMSPDGGITPSINPPVLLWPVSKKGEYSIRLSQQNDFSGKVISKKVLAYAMFNPHQQLEAGMWYWQYRSSDDEWSETSRFKITGDLREFVTPDAKEFLSMIPNEHPRVYAWKTELEGFRKRARAYEVSKEILLEADQLLKVPIIQESEALPKFKGRNARENRRIAIDASRPVCDRVQYIVSTIAQAYLLSGNAKYANSGIKWIMSLTAWDPEGPTRVTDFGDSGIMHAMAIGFDSFYDLLSQDQKEKLLIAISERGAHFYDEWVNSLEARLLSNHVWQHILERFFQTALAVKNELPLADDWLTYLYEIWIARAPILGYKDGAWSNGISYFRMNTLTMLSMTSTLKEITGVDFMQDEWYYNNPEWMIYAWPPGGSADGFGNDAYKLGNEHYPKETNDQIFNAYPELNARLTGNPYAAWYVDKRLEGTGHKATDDKSLRWFFIQRGIELSRPDPPKSFDLVQARVFREVGVAYMNTDLANASNNLRLAFKSSPYGSYSHTHAEHNCFNLFYGGKPLFSNTGYRPAMGDPHYLADFKNTRGHNGILINGMGQPFGSEAYGWIPRFLHGEQISYVVGDATHAYDATDANELESMGNPAKNNRDAGLKNFRRHILMLQPNTILIYDELETEDPSSFTFLLQNRDSLYLDESNHVFAFNPYAEANAIVFASQPVNHVLTDQFADPPVNWRRKKAADGSMFEYKNHWHYQVTNKEKAKKMRFLTIIQVKSVKKGIKYNELVKSNESNQFTVGDWEITAALDISKPAIIEIREKDGSASFVSSGILEHDGKKYSGNYEGSSKLLEVSGGIPVLKEAVDQLPESIANVMAISSKNQIQ